MATEEIIKYEYINNPILNITELPMIDESIERYQWHEYEPSARTNYNSAGEITIDIQKQDLYCQPSEAFLLFEGRLTKADDTAYANADAVALTNNGLMHLFSQIQYLISNQYIESVFYPGQATTMLGMLKYPNDFQLAQGLNQLWYKDSAATAVIADNAGFAVRQAYLIQRPTAKGTFSFIVPLKHIFGFCDDYNKVIYGFKHTLILTRKSDDDAIFRANAVAAGKVNLEKISLFMPHVLPSFMQKNELNKQIEAKINIPAAYRARLCDTITVPQSTIFSWRLAVTPQKPRYIIVAFQTNKSGSQETNPSIFDHCDIKNIYVMLNQNRYPAVDYNLSFPNQQFSRIYQDAASFSTKFYGTSDLILNSNITPSDYRDLFPIFVFDVSKYSEELKNSVSDIQIRATFNQAVPANTQAYAVVLNDRFINFKSDGQQLSVVY